MFEAGDWWAQSPVQPAPARPPSLCDNTERTGATTKEQAMEARELQALGRSISAIGVGTWQLGAD